MAQPYGYASPPPPVAQQGYYTSPPPPQGFRPPVQSGAYNPYQSQSRNVAAPQPVPVVPPPQKGTLRPGQVINVGKEQVVVQKYLSEGALELWVRLRMVLM
jgi:hypothetical protein